MTDTPEITTDASAESRARLVGMTFHSWAIEGAEISLETKADLVEFAMGDISSDEAIRRTRARYGLE